MSLEATAIETEVLLIEGLLLPFQFHNLLDNEAVYRRTVNEVLLFARQASTLYKHQTSQHCL